MKTGIYLSKGHYQLLKVKKGIVDEDFFFFLFIQECLTAAAAARPSDRQTDRQLIQASERLFNK